MTAALLAAVAWGFSDFFAGLLARRLPVLTILIGSKLAAMLLAITFLTVRGIPPPDDPRLLLGVAAGLVGLPAMGLLYRAMRDGSLAVVAPIAAVAALVPVAWGMLHGERLGLPAAVGVVVGLIGVTMSSWPVRPAAPASSAAAPPPAAPSAPSPAAPSASSPATQSVSSPATQSVSSPATPSASSPGAPPASSPAAPSAPSPAGAAVVSSRGASRDRRWVRRSADLCALGSALGFGVYFVLLHEAGVADEIWSVGLARITAGVAALTVLAAVVTRAAVPPAGPGIRYSDPPVDNQVDQPVDHPHPRPPRGDPTLPSAGGTRCPQVLTGLSAGTAVSIALVGTADALADAAFIQAAASALAPAAVVSSLYPAVTLLLTRSLLRERLHTVHLYGVLAALFAVACLAR